MPRRQKAALLGTAEWKAGRGGQDIRHTTPVQVVSQLRNHPQWGTHRPVTVSKRHRQKRCRTSGFGKARTAPNQMSHTVRVELVRHVCMAEPHNAAAVCQAPAGSGASPRQRVVMFVVANIRTKAEVGEQTRTSMPRNRQAAGNGRRRQKIESAGARGRSTQKMYTGRRRYTGRQIRYTEPEFMAGMGIACCRK